GQGRAGEDLRGRAARLDPACAAHRTAGERLRENPMNRLLTNLLVLACLGAGGARAADRPLTIVDANAGKPLYIQQCSGCHGERGNGTGPAAEFLDPRPRDFTKRLFKLRSTPTGQPPTTDDVLRTIERGIPGTAMPSFKFLPPEDRRRIAAHVLRLADLLDEPEP